MNKKIQGAVGHLRVAHAYQKLGYNVLFPFGDIQRYDLVVEKDGKFERIQIKTVAEKGGFIYADARVIGHNRSGVQIYQPNEKDFDTLAVVEMGSQEVYAIPFNGTQRQFTLRTKSAKNNQRKGVREAADHLVG